MLPDYWGGASPQFPPRFAAMLIEFPKNIGKSRDKSYSTDQKISSILVPTVTVMLNIQSNTCQALVDYVRKILCFQTKIKMSAQPRMMVSYKCIWLTTEVDWMIGIQYRPIYIHTIHKSMSSVLFKFSVFLPIWKRVLVLVFPINLMPSNKYRYSGTSELPVSVVLEN